MTKRGGRKYAAEARGERLRLPFRVTESNAITVWETRKPANRGLSRILRGEPQATRTPNQVRKSPNVKDGIGHGHAGHRP